MKRLSILCIIISIAFNLHAQIWVSLDKEGLDYRDKVFANALLKAFGEDSVSNWLKYNTGLSAFLETDTMGYLRQVIYIKKISFGRKSYLSHEDCMKLEKAWKDINLRIPFCYEPSYMKNQKELVIERIRSKPDLWFHFIGFNSPFAHPRISTLDSLKMEISHRLGSVY